MPLQRLYQRFARKAAILNDSRDPANDVSMMNMFDSGWHNSQTRELAPGFPIEKDDIVVDVGCGPGGNSAFVAKHAAEVVCVDIDPAALAEAEQRLQESPDWKYRTLVSDCNPIPLDEGYATAVLAMEVLEHVDSPADFVRELVRIGRSGARYLIAVPDPASEELQKTLAPPIYWERPNHLRIFQRDEFRRLIEDSGLTVERQYGHGFYWVLWWAFRWAAGKEEIPLGWSGSSYMLRHWNKTWKAVLTSPRADSIREAFERVLPKSQVIVARKP